jgi:hypothetical protein
VNPLLGFTRFSSIFLEAWVGFCSIMLSFAVLWVRLINLILIISRDDLDEVRNLNNMMTWGI